MKGISHFMMGVAATSFLPGAVESSFHGSSLPFVLGSVAGLVPDTVDFKFARFFARHEMELTPDPLDPDAQMIADAVAFAANDARDRQTPVRLKLNTIRLHADRWIRYTVAFVAQASEDGGSVEWGVRSRLGDVVNTGGETVEPRRTSGRVTGYAPLACDVRIEYRAEIVVDILDGPLIGMIPGRDGRVTPRWIPWHRRFSHSMVACALAALGTAAAVNVSAGLVVLLAYGSHIVADQFGHMGSSLWYPFRKGRIRGLGLMQSGDVVGNFTAVWLSAVALLWNLLRYSPGAATVDTPVGGLILAAVIPISLVALLRWLLNGPTTRANEDASK